MGGINMAIIASSSITIVDYNDALTLTGFIGSNHPKTQMYNPDNGGYIPDWSKNNLILTPSLFKLGGNSDMITSAEVKQVKWFEGNAAVAITANSTYGLSGTKNHLLTVRANTLAGLPGRDYRCEVTYLDPTSGLTLTHKMGITLTRVVNGGGITCAICTTPNGNVFKNGEVDSLVAKVELWRGSVVDTTDVAYQWYMMDPTVAVDQGAGAGWRKLTDTSSKYTGCTTAQMTVYPDAFASYGNFRVSVKDTDSSSNTYNQLFWDTVSMIDNSDPIQGRIFSTGGEIFKNGVGETQLKMQLFQLGEEVDTAGTQYNYTWKKYDRNGALVASWSRSGKTLRITGDDVDSKAVFFCNVTPK